MSELLQVLYTAILTVNIRDSSLVNIKVQVNSHNYTNFDNYPTEISGLKVSFCFYDKITNVGFLKVNKFYFSNDKTCEHHLLCNTIKVSRQKVSWQVVHAGLHKKTFAKSLIL